jgi:FKBP-type peptidyl-prolyl cis-trans isomerase 2
MPSETSKHHGVAQSGHLVRLDYDLWAEGGGRTDLIDTTHEEVAQGANLPASPGAQWGPRPHLVGGDYFPTGIEAALVGLKVGDEVEKEFAPAEAFGERDPNLIELFSMHEVSRLPEMRREDAHLDLGTVLTIEGRRGRVVTLTQARVRVDFNPAFAGRKVRGKFRVTEVISEPVDQVRAIVELQYGRAAEFHIGIHEKVVTLTVPDRSKFDISWMAAKPRVIDRIRSQVAPHSIKVVEEYITPVPEKEEKPAKGEKGEKSVKAEKGEKAEAAEKAPTEPAPETPAEHHKGADHEKNVDHGKSAEHHKTPRDEKAVGHEKSADHFKNPGPQ